MARQILLATFLSVILALGSAAQAQAGNGKNMGIAINPVLALFEWGSGEINFWNIDRHAEINLPVQYMKNPFFLDEENEEVSFFSTGLYYRRFLGEKQKGFFIQAGWLIHHARVADDFDSASGTMNSLLFGFGYRVIAKNGLFWGVGLSAGRSWGSIENTAGETLRESGLIVDVDLFKFGFAW